MRSAESSVTRNAPAVSVAFEVWIVPLCGQEANVDPKVLDLPHAARSKKVRDDGALHCGLHDLHGRLAATFLLTLTLRFRSGPLDEKP